MLNFAILQQEESLKKNQGSISREPIATAWIEKLIGDYSNPKLGDAKICYASNRQGYEIGLKDWKTCLGSELEQDGNKLLVLIDPPSYGGIKLRVEDNGECLVLELGQEKECFSRKWLKDDTDPKEILYQKNQESFSKQEDNKTTNIVTDDIEPKELTITPGKICNMI